MTNPVRRLLVCLTATVLITGATGGTSAADGPAGGAVPATAQASDPRLTMREFHQDYRSALQVVDTWWATHWSEHFPGTYTAPGLIPGHYGPGLYNRAGGRTAAPDEQFTCHGQLLPPGNALYCGGVGADFVAFDIDLLLEARQLGDVFIYFAVAHEWGHAVAADLDASLVPAEYELQADCFAGAALSGAVADGTLRWEQGDDAEVVAALTRVGDLADWGELYVDPDTGQVVLATHGSPQQRIDAFFAGATGGVTGCLATLG